eukprot:12714688-Alexandrium_andersonii.AAC.1
MVVLRVRDPAPQQQSGPVQGVRGDAAPVHACVSPAPACRAQGAAVTLEESSGGRCGRPCGCSGQAPCAPEAPEPAQGVGRAAQG